MTDQPPNPQPPDEEQEDKLPGAGESGGPGASEAPTEVSAAAEPPTQVSGGGVPLVPPAASEPAAAPPVPPAPPAADPAEPVPLPPSSPEPPDPPAIPATPDAMVPPPPPPPAPSPPFAPDAPAPSGLARDAEALLTNRPEIAVGGAFAGGLVLALILKRLAS